MIKLTYLKKGIGMINKFKGSLFFLIFFFFLNNGIFARANLKKRVILIGIDGLYIPKIKCLETPNFDKLNIRLAYTGGIRSGRKQSTKSGPGWATILTGHWVNKHQIWNNDSNNPSQVPSLFSLIRKYYKDLYLASVISWIPIYRYIRKEINCSIDFHNKGKAITDEVVMKRTVDQLKNEDPLFTFIHLDKLDTVGHSKGFGKKYNNTIENMDNKLGVIIKEIEKREKEKNENWLIIVTTDHGREIKKGFSHGSQSISERLIFIAMNKKGNELFQSSYDNSVAVKSVGQLNKTLPQTTIVPTILKFLEIPLKGKFLDTPLID